MLYEQVIRVLGPEFIQYNSEIDVPPEAQTKWGKSSLCRPLTATAPMKS